MRIGSPCAYENELVQTFWLDSSAGFSARRPIVLAGWNLLPDRVSGRGPSFALGKRHALWNLPVFRVHLSLA